MNTRLKALIPLSFCIICTIFLMSSSSLARDSISTAISNCLFSLIPTLFPYFVISSLLCSLDFGTLLSHIFSKPFKLLFGVSGIGALPLFLGILGGYPTGVRTVCTLYSQGKLSKPEADRLLLFTGNTGPAFIIGVAGLGIFSSIKVGIILYAAHVLSAMILGILFCSILGNVSQDNVITSENKVSGNLSVIFTEAVNSAIHTCINITAFVMLFSFLTALLTWLGIISVICSVLSGFGADPLKAKALILGFLEISVGLDSVSTFSENFSFSLPAIAAILSWGGISVHCQSLSFISPLGLHGKGYIFSKLLHGALSAFIVKAFISTGACESVFAFTGHTTAKSFVFDYLGLFFSLACCAFALILRLFFRHNRS